MGAANEAAPCEFGRDARATTIAREKEREWEKGEQPGSSNRRNI
jgi:hypothetical protein